MKNLSLFLSFVLAFGLLLTSCKKDDTAASVDRNQIVGTFLGTSSGTIKFSSISALGMSDQSGSVSSTLLVAIDPSVSDGLILTDVDPDGNVVFKANGVSLASNGYTFNIPSQAGVGQGNPTISGTTTYTLGSMKFDGGYISATKTLKFQINTVYPYAKGGTIYNIPAVVEYTVVKQ